LEIPNGIAKKYEDPNGSSKKYEDPNGSSKKYEDPNGSSKKFKKLFRFFIKNTIRYNIKLYLIDKDKISTKLTSFYEKL
jgi:hypothetical protein